MGLSIPQILRRLTATAVLAAACCTAQTPPPATTIVEPPTPLLPTQIGSWAQTHLTAGSATELDSASLFSCNIEPQKRSDTTAASPACKPVLSEAGLVRYASADYQKSGEARVILVFVEQFGDATGAYSAYTYYRTQFPILKPLGGDFKSSRDSFVSGSPTTVLWVGTCVVSIEGPIAKPEIEALVASLPKVSGRKALAPLLPTMFPADVSGTKPDLTTLRYSLGPVAYQTMGGQLPPEILGWDKSAEVATAAYSGRSGKGTLTLLIYPTPQVAAERGRAIEQALNDRGPATFGTVKLRRVGPLLSLTSGGFAPDQAQKLVEAVHLNEVVTFDQKMPLEFHAEVRKTATLLEEILIFTGILTIAAFVIGIFLGGARAGWRVLHGKPAASEPEFLTINLRDKPKALFISKDPDASNPKT